MLQFKGIRTVQTKNGQKNIQITGFSNSKSLSLKELLVENGIAVISISEFGYPVGNLYEVGVVSKDEEIIDIVFPVEGKIRDAFKYFIDTFGIIENIKYIKPYGKEIEEVELIKILDLLKKENGLINDDIKIRKGKNKLKNKGDDIVLQGKLKEKLLASVDEFIQEMEEFLPYTEAEFPVETKKLEDLLGILKKYKLSTNLYKLSDNYKKALKLAEQLQNKYFDYQKQRENKLTTIKLISELEIIAEYKSYEKVKRAKVLEKVNSKEFSFPWYETLYYKVFGKTGIYIKLLIQEFFKKLDQKGLKFNEVILFFQFLIIFLIINYTILGIYFLLNQNYSKNLSAFYMIMMFSYFGIWITSGKFFLEKNKTISIVLIILGLVSWNLIKYYFGL